MRLSNKAGCDYGVDYGAVVVFFLWVVATIVLLVVLAVRGNSQNMALAQTSLPGEFFVLRAKRFWPKQRPHV